MDPGDDPLRAVAVPLDPEHLPLRLELGEHAFERNPVGDAGALRELVEREGNRDIEMASDKRAQRRRVARDAPVPDRGARERRTSRSGTPPRRAHGARSRTRRSVPSSSVTCRSRRAALSSSAIGREARLLPEDPERQQEVVELLGVTRRRA